MPRVTVSLIDRKYKRPLPSACASRWQRIDGLTGGAQRPKIPIKERPACKDYTRGPPGKAAAVGRTVRSPPRCRADLCAVGVRFYKDGVHGMMIVTAGTLAIGATAGMMLEQRFGS